MLSYSINPNDSVIILFLRLGLIDLLLAGIFKKLLFC